MNDRVCPNLRSAREKLCVAQTNVEHYAHKQWLQDALDIIDRIGVMVCPDWSCFDEPSVRGEEP